MKWTKINPDQEPEIQQENGEELECTVRHFLFMGISLSSDEPETSGEDRRGVAKAGFALVHAAILFLGTLFCTWPWPFAPLDFSACRDNATALGTALQDDEISPVDTLLENEFEATRYAAQVVLFVVVLAFAVLGCLLVSAYTQSCRPCHARVIVRVILHICFALGFIIMYHLTTPTFTLGGGTCLTRGMMNYWVTFAMTFLSMALLQVIAFCVLPSKSPASLPLMSASDRKAQYNAL